MGTSPVRTCILELPAVSSVRWGSWRNCSAIQVGITLIPGFQEQDLGHPASPGRMPFVRLAGEVVVRRVLMRFAARACMMRLSAPTISRRELTSGISMLDSRCGRPRGPWGAPVEVTEGAAAHGGRFAVESTVHDVAAFFQLGHEACSCWHFGNGVPPSPPPGGERTILRFLRVAG